MQKNRARVIRPAMRKRLRRALEDFRRNPGVLSNDAKNSAHSECDPPRAASIKHHQAGNPESLDYNPGIAKAASKIENRGLMVPTEMSAEPSDTWSPADSANRLSIPDSGGPSQTEIATLVGLSFVLFISVVSLGRNYFAVVDNFGDSLAYMSLASAIRHWDFHGIIVKQFWGLPYAMAALSTLTRVSDRTALLVLSMIPSLIAGLLARRLWDGWIAGYFVILNFDWLQRSYLGGSEPLFVCLLFAAFVSVRRERWILASLLASFATVVRPLGFFALVGIGVWLLWKRDFRRFAAATSISLLVGVLYAVPLAAHFGDPLANVASYHSQQWQGGWLFGFPFYAMVKGTLLYPAPWTNLALSFAWIFLVVAAVIVMARSAEFRDYCRLHAVETAFFVPYLWCLFTYNYPHWARGSFPRFAIPILWLCWRPSETPAARRTACPSAIRENRANRRSTRQWCSLPDPRSSQWCC